MKAWIHALDPEQLPSRSNRCRPLDLLAVAVWDRLEGQVPSGLSLGLGLTEPDNFILSLSLSLCLGPAQPGPPGEQVINGAEQTYSQCEVRLELRNGRPWIAAQQPPLTASLLRDLFDWDSGAPSPARLGLLTALFQEWYDRTEHALFQFAAPLIDRLLSPLIDLAGRSRSLHEPECEPSRALSC